MLRPLTSLSAGAPQRVTGGVSPARYQAVQWTRSTETRTTANPSPRRLAGLPDATRQSKASQTKAPCVPTIPLLQCGTAPAAALPQLTPLLHVPTPSARQASPTTACEINHFSVFTSHILIPFLSSGLRCGLPVTNHRLN